MSCSRPSCPDAPAFLFRDLCPSCVRAEMRAEWAIEFDREREECEYRGELWPVERRQLDTRSLHVLPRMTDTRGTPYGLAALRQIIQRLAERADRNNALFAASAQLGELVAGGQIEGTFAYDCLIETAEQVAPDERWKSKDTINRGMRQGMQHPRQPRRAA